MYCPQCFKNPLSFMELHAFPSILYFSLIIVGQMFLSDVPAMENTTHRNSFSPVQKTFVLCSNSDMNFKKVEGHWNTVEKVQSGLREDKPALYYVDTWNPGFSRPFPKENTVMFHFKELCLALLFKDYVKADVGLGLSFHNEAVRILELKKDD